MCGILGGNRVEWDYEKGIEEIKHRGPDGQKVIRFEKFAMAFARLSIMDLSEKAMQPMQSSDNQISLIFNGEIYGFQDLRTTLKKKYVFQTTSDTEVILNAYLEYGDSFINKIDGMFAIVIYDRRVEKVKLFRDRAGIKPLYYYFDGVNFAFASEIKALEATCKDIKFEIDNTALYDYLFYQYIPDPKTMYKNMYKLLPAHTLVFDIIKLRIITLERYWKLKVNTSVDRKRKREDINEAVRYLIAKSVKEQMVADVPVGTYLSGGIDSSIITLECSKIRPDIRTFTIGFHEKQYDESKYADLLINKYHINSKKQILDKRYVEQIKGSMASWYDEPFADTSAYPTYVVSELAKKEVTVVLTGDGSDELFGGYRRYSDFSRKIREYPKRSQTLEKMAEYALHKGLIAEELFEKKCLSNMTLCARTLAIASPYRFREFHSKWNIPKDYDPYWYLKKYYKKDIPPITRMRYLDFKTYLPSDILTKVDRTSMAVSLESRVPFLSRDLIEFAFSLSQEECCPKDNLKGILKNAYRGDIPCEILDRVKRGFSVPPNYLLHEKKEVSSYAGVLKNEWPELWR